ncbi:MAG: HAMP domain-containing sensor histidine kinase [Bacillota bacterium]
MKKLSLKIVVALVIVFAISTLIPRIIFRQFADLPAREIFESNVFFVGMLLTAGVSLLLFALAMNYIIINRVRRLSTATKQVANGNFDIHITSQGKDELSSLTNDFNQMVYELRSNEYLNKEFIRNFSHEFKTPISAIKGYAELIVSGNLSSAEITEYSDIIAKESSRLSNLSVNILQLSILDSTSIVKVDQIFNVSEQIRSVIQLMQLAWEEKHLDLNLEIEEMQIQSNKELTYQVWKNLIENAINYSKDNQKLDISVKSDGTNALFAITNYGLGISDIDKPHIFELFYVVEKSRHQTSSGVGLSITKRIVERLKGSISFESEENQFTTFHVKLPIESDKQ